jgi:hypothetical protein
VIGGELQFNSIFGELKGTEHNTCIVSVPAPKMKNGNMKLNEKKIQTHKRTNKRKLINAKICIVRQNLHTC